MAIIGLIPVGVEPVRSALMDVLLALIPPAARFVYQGMLPESIIVACCAGPRCWAVIFALVTPPASNVRMGTTWVRRPASFAALR